MFLGLYSAGRHVTVKWMSTNLWIWIWKKSWRRTVSLSRRCFLRSGAVMLLASTEGLLPGFLSYNPYLILVGTLVMRLPLIAGLKPLLDRRALLGLVFLTGYSYIIEYVGITTGFFPYGELQYLIELGPLIAGKVPLGLPIFSSRLW